MKIKEKPQDFVVEEITPDGDVLEIEKEYAFSGGDGEHLICVLEKINWDTNRVIKFIAKRLHVSQKRIGFAGTKDKRAWTTQRISIWNAKPEDVEKVNLKDINIWPISRSDERVKLGDLWGNRFTIVLRDISPEILERFSLPTEFKVPNFFGIQRFGEKRPVTHLVGKALVKQDVELAVKTYLAWEGDGEREETKEARRKLSESWGWREALSYFPKHLSYERTLLEYLAKNPNDYANAMRRLPRNLLKMFVHAYQSYLFNRYLEERTNHIGLEATTGDVIQSGVAMGPLFGYEFELATGEPGAIEKGVLEEEAIKLEDFRIKSLPEASSKGNRRPVYITVRDYKVLKSGNDWIKLRFKLEKGSYATTVLDWILGVHRSLPSDIKFYWPIRQ